VPRSSRVVPCVIAAMLWAIAGVAHAQSNLEAGKSPAQIFSDTCNACHRSPREIKKTSPAFLREHYTTGLREATTMAAYLASVGSDPRAVQQRRPPAMGAGQAPAAETHPTAAPQAPEVPKPDTQAALPGAAVAQPPTAAWEGRPRRPSESMEFGLPSAAGGPEAATPQTAAMPAMKRYPGGEIEE
jgi:cell division protein FtsN